MTSAEQIAEQILDEIGVPKKKPTRTGEPHRGQLRMAERLATRHAEKLRHAHGLGWLIWDGKRWAPDLDGAAMRAAVDTIKAALREVADLDGDARNELYADIRKTESASGLNGMLTIAAALQPIAVAAERLDEDPFLFNTANGTLDLRTGQLRPHDPGDLITKVAGCGLDLEAKGEIFTRFLAEILPDEEVRLFVQRLFGYAMLGKVREHIMPFFTGTGKNGKSTVLNVVSEAFGDYAIAAEPELLIERGQAHPTGQADLQGVRLATCLESDEGRTLAASTMKRLTGGDKIRARRMRRDFFEFDATHTLILATNHKPKVAGDDPALWRRLAIVPFDVVVADEDIDTKLPEKLALELPAVLAWAFAGYQDYVENGLATPAAVTERTKEYQVSSDALGRFIEERAIVNQHMTVSARELYTAYSTWCMSTGEPGGSEVSFAEAMGRRGFERKRTARGNVYRGLGLAADESSTTSHPFSQANR